MTEEDSVKEHLSICFCDNTLIWYLQKLSDFTCWALKIMSLSDFINALAIWFKMNINKTLDKLNWETYSLLNAQMNRKSQHYIQNIILYSQTADFQNSHSQLMWVWQHLNVKLWSMILMSKEDITIQNFSKELNIWKNL